MCQHILTREAASLRLMPGGAISGLVDLNEGGLGRGPSSWQVGRATPPPTLSANSAPPPSPTGALPSAGCSESDSVIPGLRAVPSAQLPPARGQAGGREGGGRKGRFIQRSELRAPALGSHPITLTGQFTEQLCSEGRNNHCLLKPMEGGGGRRREGRVAFLPSNKRGQVRPSSPSLAAECTQITGESQLWGVLRVFFFLMKEEP